MERFYSLIALSAIFFNCYGQTRNTDNSRIKSEPFVIGEIVEINSKILNETRTLNIYLPENYKSAGTSRYQVIYLLDGSADEDFIYIAGLVQFNMLPWIEQLPNTIVVGISNTDRKRDFTFPTSLKAEQERYKTSGKSESFIDFIEKELQSFIATNYRINNDKTIIGQSLGGLLATEILMKKSYLFNRYIIISPSLWWDNGSILNQLPDILNENYSGQASIYIGVGKEGLTPSDTPHVMEVDANLLAEKLKSAKNKNVKVYFDYLPNEDHATINHQAVFNAFRILYPLTTGKK